jgi:lysozyme
MEGQAMNISDRGIKFIQECEGVRLNAYLDSIGIPTIGVGHTGPEVCMGQTITPDECSALLRTDLAKAEDAVNFMVKVDINQDQFDALVSFAFNVGIGALGKSTLLRKLNAGDYAGAAAEFLRWDQAGGKHIPGLLKRRHAESALFQSEMS